MSYQVCDTCTPAVLNDDYSGFDIYDVTDDDMASVFASVEAMGNATVATDGTGKTRRIHGYFRCFVCSDDSLGGYYFEAV